MNIHNLINKPQEYSSFRYNTYLKLVESLSNVENVPWEKINFIYSACNFIKERKLENISEMEKVDGDELDQLDDDESEKHSEKI